MLTDHRCPAPSSTTKGLCLQLLRTRAPLFEFSPYRTQPSSTSSEEARCRPGFIAWHSMRHPPCSAFPLQRRPFMSSNLVSRALRLLLKHHHRPPSHSIRFGTGGIVKAAIRRPSRTPVILPSAPIHQFPKLRIENTTEPSWA